MPLVEMAGKLAVFYAAGEQFISRLIIRHIEIDMAAFTPSIIALLSTSPVKNGEEDALAYVSPVIGAAE